LPRKDRFFTPADRTTGPVDPGQRQGSTDFHLQRDSGPRADRPEATRAGGVQGLGRRPGPRRGRPRPEEVTPATPQGSGFTNLPKPPLASFRTHGPRVPIEYLYVTYIY